MTVEVMVPPNLRLFPGYVVILEPVAKRARNAATLTDASKEVLASGTASYDNLAAADAQLHGFADSGCAISNLSVSYLTPTNATMRAAVAAADIILVSGGNTLFATDRWRRLGLDVDVGLERASVQRLEEGEDEGRLDKGHAF